MNKSTRAYKGLNGNNEVVRLGSLGLGIKFVLPDDETIYKTLTYPRSSVNHSTGCRECMNLSNNKLKIMVCRTWVIVIT